MSGDGEVEGFAAAWRALQERLGPDPLPAAPPPRVEPAAWERFGRAHREWRAAGAAFQAFAERLVASGALPALPARAELESTAAELHAAGAHTVAEHLLELAAARERARNALVLRKDVLLGRLLAGQAPACLAWAALELARLNRTQAREGAVDRSVRLALTAVAPAHADSLRALLEDLSWPPAREHAAAARLLHPEPGAGRALYARARLAREILQPAAEDPAGDPSARALSARACAALGLPPSG